MGHRGYGPHGQWGTGVWAMRPTGGIGYRGMGHMGNRGTWGTRGMGHMGNGMHEQWGTGV